MHGSSVLVAGAGLAGLVAAHELARAGALVTVVDARDYAGGRVRTVRAFEHGGYAEAGGEFIEPAHKETVGLCQAFGLRLVRVLHAGFAHRHRGADGRFHLSRTEPWQRLSDALQPLINRYKASRGDPSADAVREMATMSLREWLRRVDAPADLHAMVDAMRGFFLAEAEEISVLPYVEQLSQGGSPAQSELHRIEGGNDRLVDALVRATPARLLFGHVIHAISQATDRVVVTSRDASGLTQQLEADAIVVALPASTLRDVEIRPALPDDQQRAIQRLSYGCATKVIVQSPRSLFGDRHARAFATDTRLGAFWDASEHQQQPGSIAVFLGGGAAASWLRDAAAHGADDLMGDLCWLGMNAAPIAHVHVADWSADPHSRGGYAYFDPAFDPAWRALLRKPAGRIVFAGEHTSERWQGFMNGAVESGQRAARELLGRQ